MNKFQDAMADAESEAVPDADAVFGSRPMTRASRASANLNALVKREDGAFIYKRFEWLPTGMILPEDTTVEEWQEVGEIIQRLNTAIQWVIGDWILFGERKWGDTYSAIMEATGYEYGTVKDFVYVCRNVQLSVRTDKLDFGHHKVVAAQGEAMQAEWLNYGATLRLSVAGLRRDIGLLRGFDDETALAWIRHALAMGLSLSQLPEFKTPALPKPSRDDRLAATYSDYIQNMLPGFEQMDGDSRRAIGERARWLSDYYANIAQKALQNRA